MQRFLKDPSFLFPLVLIAFVGTAVSYVNAVFNTDTRWLVLAFLFVYLLLAGKLFRCLRGEFGLLLLANIAWCLLTWFWSEVPELTGPKAVAFAALTLGAASGGMEWARTRSADSVIAGLFPLTVLAIFAGFFGYTTPGGGWDTMGEVTLYQGLTGNSNMLGMLAAMGFPYAIWRFYSSGRPGATRHAYLISVGLLAAILLIELYSVSRASLVVIVCISIFYLIAQQKGRQALYVLTAVIVAVIVVLAAPDLIQDLLRYYVYKGDPNADILVTRENVWRDSYELALKGGWIGGGYGVTIGETNFDGGLTAVGYGRQKGNAQLAITEELGLVGLGLYGALLAILFGYLIRTFKRIRSRNERVAFGVVTGAIVGMIANSVFEAWWVAPGSPEMPYFWGLVGIVLGLGRFAATTENRQNMLYWRSRPKLTAQVHAMSRR